MLHWQLVFHQFIRPSVSLPVVKELLNKIIQEKIHFCWQRWWVLKLVRVFLKHLYWFCVGVGEWRQTGEEPEQAPLLDYNTRTPTHKGFWYQDYYRIWPTRSGAHIRRRRRRRPCVFCFDRRSKFEARQIFFEAFTFIPTGSKSFWSRDWFARDWVTWDWFEEFLVTRLIHVGLSRIIFLVAQATTLLRRPTYFEVSSFSTNSEEEDFILHHGVDRSPNHRFL